jgi:dephospho-CoA kinase
VKIALTGRIRAGKDTVAEYLQESYGFNRYAFGNGIRDICKRAFPYLLEHGKPRALYQGVGQALREFDQDVWVKYLDRVIEDECWPEDHIIITDLRQPNEYKHLREKGFFIVRVSSSFKTRFTRAYLQGDTFSVQDFNHETEAYVDRFQVDYILSNDKTVDDLYREIDTLLKYLGGDEDGPGRGPGN